MLLVVVDANVGVGALYWRWGIMPRVSNLVCKRHVQFAGHCACAADELVS